MALTMLLSVLKCDANTYLLVEAICRSCVTLRSLPMPTVTTVTPARLRRRAGAVTESSDLLAVITMATFRLVERENSEDAANLRALPSLAFPFMEGIRPSTFVKVAWFVKRLKSNSFLGMLLNSTMPKRVALVDTVNEDTMCFKKLRSRRKFRPRTFDETSTIKPMSKAREHTANKWWVEIQISDIEWEIRRLLVK